MAVERTFILQPPRLDPVLLHYFEGCVGCMVCAPACPYYYVEERYSPPGKAEYLREILRAHYTAIGKILKRLAGARIPRSREELWKVLEYAYRCTNCGHCYTSCVFGIDSGHMVRLLRETLYKVGVAPTTAKLLTNLEASRFAENPTVKQAWSQFLNEASTRGIPIGKRNSRVLVMVSFVDATLMKDTTLKFLEILKRVGEDFTIPERPMGLRPPLGYVIGDRDAEVKVTKEVVEEAEALAPRALVILDGGHPYSYFRFEATNTLRRKFPFEVLHVTELLARYFEEGRLRAVRKVGGRVTWHDPCQLGRRAGVFEEPREILRQITSDFRELPHKKAGSYCCGGGGFMFCLTKEGIELTQRLLNIDIWGRLGEEERRFVERADEDVKRAVRRKIDDIRKSGASIVTTACPVCIETIRLGARLYGLNIEVRHIVDLVYEAIS